MHSFCSSSPQPFIVFDKEVAVKMLYKKDCIKDELSTTKTNLQLKLINCTNLTKSNCSDPLLQKL